MFIYAILLMSFASLGIGILPTHWGWISLGLSVALSYAGCYALASFAPVIAAFLLLHQGNDYCLLILIEGAPSSVY